MIDYFNNLANMYDLEACLWTVAGPKSIRSTVTYIHGYVETTIQYNAI